MTIRSGAIRAGIFITTIIIGAILAIQLFWLFKIYHYEEKNFDHNVLGAFKELYSSTDLLNKPSQTLNSLVKKENPQLYLGRIEKSIPPVQLAAAMEDALDDFEIYAHSHITIFNSDEGGVQYKLEVHSAQSDKEAVDPVLKDLKGSYLLLYFPTRERYILSNMQLWIVSSVILLGVLIWLGASIFYLYRQKNLNELQRDLVNNFTHEFKTPLAVITLALESLRKKSVQGQSERVDKYAEMIGNQTSYLQQQIDRLLRHSHLEKSNPKLRLERANIALLVEQAIQQLQPLIEHKNASISIDNNAEDPEIQVDPNYIMIVLINLIENALKYSSKPQVRITVSDDDLGVSVSVKDNGEGIEEKHFKDIFRKFYRVPKGDIHSAKGFGIGLSFVKKIMDAHKGLITVRSTPGVGSDFTFRLSRQIA